MLQSFSRAWASMGQQRRLRSAGSAYETNQFLIGIRNFPGQVDRLIAERRTLQERVASGDDKAVEHLDYLPTTGRLVYTLYEKAVKLVPKNRRRTWGSGFHYGKVGRELKDGHPMFIIDRDIITTYYGIRTGALALQARGYYADWKGFRGALDKGIAADLAQEFDDIRVKRANGDETWRDDFYGFEHRLGSLMLTAPHKMDVYRGVKLMNRDFLQYADMAVDYIAGEIGKYLPHNNSWAVMNNLRKLHHLYLSTVKNEAIPAPIREAFENNVDRVAAQIYAKADAAGADEAIEIFREIRAGGHPIAQRPRHPELVHRGIATVAGAQAKLLTLMGRLARRRQGPATEATAPA